jgi:bifunctional non-homologous end joining protein LigD
MRGRSLKLRGGRGGCQTGWPVTSRPKLGHHVRLRFREANQRRCSHVRLVAIVEDERKKSKEIENIRRTEERRGKRQPESEVAHLRRRLERNAGDLLELDLEEFLKALKEDYQLNESQRKGRGVLASESRRLATRFSNRSCILACSAGVNVARCSSSNFSNCLEACFRRLFFSGIHFQTVKYGWQCQLPKDTAGSGPNGTHFVSISWTLIIQTAMAGKPSVVEIEGKHLSLTNLDKVLYPKTGFTKGQVVDYYARIAPVLLPQLAGRPLTLKRYPEGVDKEYFFEKNATKHRPDWVKTAPIWSEGNQRNINYILANDLPTLVWIANLASIELHPSLSLAKDITSPRSMVFDLDPGPPANIVQCCQVGMWLREIFEHFGLQSFPKTSGSKGLQIYVPLNSPTSYDVTKTFAHALARLLENDHRKLVVSDMKKQVRVGKVFVDWSQNDQHKTTVSVYSLRAREHPTVSTPVKWEEVEQALKKKDATLLVFEASQVLDRVREMGDLFESLVTLKQKLPKLVGIAEIEPVAAEAGLEIAAQAENPKKAKTRTKPARGRSVPKKRRKV